MTENLQWHKAQAYSIDDGLQAIFVTVSSEVWEDLPLDERHYGPDSGRPGQRYKVDRSGLIRTHFTVAGEDPEEEG